MAIQRANHNTSIDPLSRSEPLIVSAVIDFYFKHMHNLLRPHELTCQATCRIEQEPQVPYLIYKGRINRR